MIYDYHAVRQYKKPGDSIWACRYSESNIHDKRRLFQKPVRGVLSSYHDMVNPVINDRDRINYFIPYKKNRTDPAFNRSVGYAASWYADSEEECVMAYNQQIQDTILFHEDRIRQLESDLMTSQKRVARIESILKECEGLDILQIYANQSEAMPIKEFRLDRNETVPDEYMDWSGTFMVINQWEYGSRYQNVQIARVFADNDPD